MRCLAFRPFGAFLWLVAVLPSDWPWRLASAEPGEGQEVSEEEEEEDPRDRIVRCRPSRRPDVYPPVSYLAPTMIRPCGSIPVTDLIGASVELLSVATQKLSATAELVMVTQRRGPIHQIDVLTDGDNANWDVFRPVSRTFRGHSCLNLDMFCDVVSVNPVPTGFWVIDRHRVMDFNFTWRPEATETVMKQIGQFNNAAGDGLGDTDLLFPTEIAIYNPYNETFLSEDIEMTPNMPDADQPLLFISDTGNHRVVMFNMTMDGGLEKIGQFGVTGQARSDELGMNWPHGIAVMSPAPDWSFAPNYANIFVADRRNHRLLKLNLGYPRMAEGDADGWDFESLTLMYGGQFGGHGSDVAHNETLMDPVGVAVFRHYIFVAEAGGNQISVLQVHPSRLNEMVLVTTLTSKKGIQLSGHLSISEMGYIWYTFTDLPTGYGLASLFLAEELRESPPSIPIDDIVDECLNDTWYHEEMRFNVTLYYEHVSYLLRASYVNWEFPNMTGFVDILSFNRTYDFDLDLLNGTCYNGRMQLCDPPVASTTPAMLSGGDGGWSGDGGLASSAGSRRSGMQAFWLTLAVGLLGRVSRD